MAKDDMKTSAWDADIFLVLRKHTSIPCPVLDFAGVNHRHGMNAILLLQHEELSYADVAAVLGASYSATKTLIHRGRQTLKRELQPYLRTGSWRAS
jgi:hypothetical protein